MLTVSALRVTYTCNYPLLTESYKLSQGVSADRRLVNDRR